MRLNHDLLPLALRSSPAPEPAAAAPAAPGDALTGLAHVTPAPTPSAAPGCATCAHVTPARTCGEPDAAGLVEPGRFGVVWLVLIGDHGRTCPAWRLRVRVPPSELVPALSAAQVAEVRGWSAVEMQRAKRYAALAAWRGFSLADADGIADRLTLRDRQHDGRRMCLECGRLDPYGRCGAARSGRLAVAGLDLHPLPVLLQRCPAFVVSQIVV